QSQIELEHNSQKYYQVDDLYLYPDSDINYLSSKEDLIKDLISQNVLISQAWKGCLEQEAEVSDFLYLETNQLASGPIKDYLEAKSIETINISSYSTSSISGLQLCF
ncbi:hypothetical protein K8R42_03850, partial [bacterium]|nr:hypothetical protein [bacterium]